MPAGTVSRTTLGPPTAPPNNGDATAYEVRRFPASAAGAGRHVMAVKSIQQNDTSSDVSSA